MDSRKASLLALALGLMTWSGASVAGRTVSLGFERRDIPTLPSTRLQTPTPQERAETGVTLQLDDGTVEGCIWTFAQPGQFLYANRFNPALGDLPFVLTNVALLHSDALGLGDPIEIVIARDPDGDTCFQDMEVLYTEMVAVHHNDSFTWDLYTLRQPVLFTSGDLYIGAIQRESPYFPCMDETSPQGMSWMGNWFTTTAPSPVTMPPDRAWFEIGSVWLPGNWLIRGTGTTLDAFFELGSVAFDDSCPYGYGDGDGVLDPGELFRLTVPVTNNGPMAVSDLAGTLSSANGAAVLASASAQVGSLDAGATAILTFEGALSPNASCGTELPFTLHLNGSVFPIAWDLAFSEAVGTPDPATEIEVLTERFETWPLTAWTILNISSHGGPWSQGSSLVCYSGGRTNETGACGDFASADADCHGDLVGGTDTQLISPQFSLAGFSKAALEFFTDLNDYYGTTIGSVQITVDGGSTWSDVQVWTGPGVGWANLANGRQTFSLAPYAGEPACQLRFWYVAPLWEAWWQVDDVRVIGVTPAGPCISNDCIPPFQIWITIPVNGGGVYGMTTLCAAVTDLAQVASVNFYVDGAFLGAGAAPPYCVAFDASALPIGAHIYTLEAVLAEGGSYWGAPVTLYTVPSVTAFPEASPPAGVAPLEVAFFSNAMFGTGSYAYEWYFGDAPGGSGAHSLEQNPTHVYPHSGDYLVTLLVEDTSGAVFICDPIKVAVVGLAERAEVPRHLPGKGLIRPR